MNPDEFKKKYLNASSRSTASKIRKWSKEICETMYVLFHANPSFSRCVYLAYYGPDTSPDIRDFAEDMAIHSERTYFPVITGNTLSFFEQGTKVEFEKNKNGIYEPLDITDPLPDDEHVIIFIPYEIFAGNLGPDIAECYKNFIMSYPNVEGIYGIAFDSQIGTEPDTDKMLIVPESIITENRIIHL